MRMFPLESGEALGMYISAGRSGTGLLGDIRHSLGCSRVGGSCTRTGLFLMVLTSKPKKLSVAILSFSQKRTMGRFSVAEISHAMMTSEANVQKRITRAQERLRENSSLGGNAEFHDRIDAASMVIYLMFNEDWPRIRELYQILLQRVSSPSQWLNRAVAEFYCFGSKAALSSLRELPVGDPPKGYPMWFAVIGFFYYSDGNFEEAKNHWGEALKCTHSRAEQELLRRRIALCQRQER
jgi:predicted RNA polymerase sigma factor